MKTKTVLNKTPTSIVVMARVDKIAGFSATLHFNGNYKGVAIRYVKANIKRWMEEQKVTPEIGKFYVLKLVGVAVSKQRIIHGEAISVKRLEV